MAEFLRWCRQCCTPQPRAEFQGIRCKQCAAKSAAGKTKWLFDAAGNVISKGQSAKTTRASVGAPALKTTKE